MPADPQSPPVLVILGGAGDLALRMLAPSLSNLEADGVLPAGLRVIAVGRGQGDAESYRAEVRAALEKRGEFEENAWEGLARRLDYCPADVTTAKGAQKLAASVRPGVEVRFI